MDLSFHISFHIQKIDGQWVVVEIDGRRDFAPIGPSMPLVAVLDRIGCPDVVVIVEGADGVVDVVGIDDAVTGDWLETLEGDEAMLVGGYWIEKVVA